MNKKFLQFFVLCFVAVFSFVFVGCKTNEPANNNQDTTQTTDDNGQNEIADTSEAATSIKTSVNKLKSSITTEQTNSTLPNASNYKTGVYEITAETGEGNYYFTGNLAGKITVKKGIGNVHIFLDSVNFSIEDDNVIAIKDDNNVTITLIGESTLQNTKNASAEHVIKSSQNLTINGSGSLTINSTKSAISCGGTFLGLGGSLNISASKNGITADSIYIAGSKILGVSCKDLIHAESNYDGVETIPEFDFTKGFVYIESGTLQVDDDGVVLGDGIQADSFVYIKDGTLNLTTTPTWNDFYTAMENNEKGKFDATTHQKIAAENVRAGSTYAVLEESVKGIKVGQIDYYFADDTTQEKQKVESDNYTVLIEGGNLDINTIDDAIHVNSGSILCLGGSITINTSDDGIHADRNVSIAGNAIVDIQNCFEGIEAETIDISGGKTTIIAIDDGMNATNGDLDEFEQKEICQINISDGWLDVTVSPQGIYDGIDSNGGICISGGVIIARGPNNLTSTCIDAGKIIEVTGGIMITLGNAPGATGMVGQSRSGGRTDGMWSISKDLVKSQTRTAGLSMGQHTVTIGDTVISYTNKYSYSGYTTVYANSSATIN